MIIEKITVSPIQENCYIVGDEESHAGVIIDPGAEASRILEKVEHLGLTIEKIVNTHGHVDHISAAEEVKAALEVKLHMHPGDEMYLPNIEETAQMFGISGARNPTLDVFLTDGDRIDVGGFTIEVIHAPGHTPGSCVLKVGDDVFCGDLVFSGSIGRTDLPGGDYNTIIDSLERVILPMGDDVRLHPGHGPSTTVAVERRFNPFLQGLRPQENRSGPM
ncbi:MAG: MBL fold metallo-hydrolase [candidate division Zixibacteria bacterium]|nr:MBL fold metallo-hydrolase [candidate division Zixibacteria bacterium]